MSKKLLRYLVLLAVPIALFFAMRARLSWRPRVLGQLHITVTAVAWSPDGKWMAFAPEVGNATLPIEVWDVSRGELHNLLKAKHGFDNFLQFSGDSNFLYALDEKMSLRRWEVDSGEELSPFPRKINRMAFAL